MIFLGCQAESPPPNDLKTTKLKRGVKGNYRVDCPGKKKLQHAHK